MPHEDIIGESGGRRKWDAVGHATVMAVPPEPMSKHVWVGLLGQDITLEHAAKAVATYPR